MRQVLIVLVTLLSVGFVGIALLMGAAVFYVGVVLPHLSLAGWCCFLSPQLAAAQPF